MNVCELNASGDDDVRFDEADDALRHDHGSRRELRTRARTAGTWTGADVTVMVARLRGHVMRRVRHRSTDIVHRARVDRRGLGGENRQPAAEQQRSSSLNPRGRAKAHREEVKVRAEGQKGAAT